MPWPTLALAVAVASAVVMASLTPAVLRALPEPAEPDGKPPYASLATPGFLLGVGLATATATGVVVALAPVAHWLAWASLCLVNVLACAIDARTTWLPLVLARVGWVVAAAGAVVVALASSSWTPILAAALGAGAVGGFFHLVWRITGAFGYGDVRLAATIGAVTALDSTMLVVAAVMAGTVLGALWGVLHAARGRGSAFPYGPGLLAGPFVALLLQGSVLAG